MDLWDHHELIERRGGAIEFFFGHLQVVHTLPQHWIGEMMRDDVQTGKIELQQISQPIQQFFIGRISTPTSCRRLTPIRRRSDPNRLSAEDEIVRHNERIPNNWRAERVYWHNQ